MAGNSLGALTVRLGLDAAEFVDGLSKSERQAQKFGQRIGKQFEAAGKVAAAGLAVMAAGAVAAFAAMDQLVKQAADFQDLAEMTGASAEGLASFAVAAATAGVEMSSVASAMNLLTKNLVGVDDESKAAGAAIKALGLNVEEFKRLDPAAQYEAVGEALSGFADGAGKTAVAMALFGKAGAEQLKVFKALEEAGGRQIILTGEQIRQADAYADSQAKARAELNLYAQLLATQGLRAVTAFTGALTDTIKAILGVDEGTKTLANSTAVQTFAQNAAKALAFVIDSGDLLIRVFQAAGQSIYSTASAAGAAAMWDLDAAKSYIVTGLAEIQRIINAPTFGSRLDARLADAANFDDEARRRAGRGVSRPSLGFSGAVKADKPAKAIKERETEAERYLEQLQRQLDKTRDLNVEETLLAELASGRLKISGKVTEQQLVEVARRIDMAKKEADVLAEAKKDQLAHIQFSRAVAAEAGYATDKRTEEYQALQERLMSVGSAMGETQRMALQMGDAFGNAMEQLVMGGASASDVFKNLATSLAQMVWQIGVMEPMAARLRASFGSASGSPPNPYAAGAGGGIDWGGLFGNVLGGLFGGARAIGGSVEAGSMHPVNERGPELLDVNGRQFLMMGNQRGRVTPLSGGQAGSTVIFNVTVPAGTPRETGLQIAAIANQRLAMGRRNM